MRLKHIDELHQLTCERSRHPHIFIPFLVDKNWLLAVIKPDSHSGHVLVRSSHSSNGIFMAVENELRPFLLDPNGTRPKDGGFAPPDHILAHLPKLLGN